MDADHTKNTVVELDLKDLTPNIQIEDLKKLANVKHVIKVVVDHDSITNQCVGTGKVKLRLGPNDSVENVKMQYMKAGYKVLDHEHNPKKKTKFT